jgi:CheY-like chemotaxis protein/HPt (histidine-containing phosphotransfer) domain-containing protein
MKKILIVEDDELVANTYGNRFSREGFEVSIAPDGLAGLDLVRSFQPDAVILDLMLPKMTGVELTKKIRAEPNLERLPVIVLSNAYLTSVMEQACKAGATKCLSKADSIPRQVVEVVRKLLARNGAPVAAPPPPADAATPPRQPSALAQATPASDRAPSGDPDAAIQAELRKSFIEGLPATLTTLRTLLQGVVKAENKPIRLLHLHELYRHVHALSGNAGVVGAPQIARMSDALEVLLKELYEQPKNITASTLRTLAVAIDFLGTLFEQGIGSDKLETPPPNVLVVDDEAISRRAVTCALEKARLKFVSVEDPAAAYALLTKNRFDLVFLDVDMPGMNGYELCARLRTLPEHKDTPVVFVTGLNDFGSRANSSMGGGTDVIAKPFHFIELAVKALVYVLRNRLRASR